MGFKAREIWAWSLGILTLFYQLISQRNQDLYIIDILFAVVINAGIGFLIGTAISAFKKRQMSLDKEKSSYSSIATTTHQSGLIQNHQVTNTANSFELSEFLEKLPEPLASENRSMTDGWFNDPLKRWSSRFNQGLGGEVGWTNRVLDDSGQEHLDDLTTSELKDADLLHPVNQQKPSKITSFTRGAGWFPDPSGFFKTRFWSGRSWTLDVRDEFDNQIRWESIQPPSAAQLKFLATEKIGAQNDPQTSKTTLDQIDGDSKEKRLDKIVSLYEKGLISRSEFETIKQEIFY